VHDRRVLPLRGRGGTARALAHRTLTITRKGGKIVTIPLAPRTARAIDLAIGERLDGPIFLTDTGQRVDRHGAGRIVRRIARRAGITRPVGPHTLRHAFITAALDAGVPLRDVQEAASHADPRTTMRYDRAKRPSSGWASLTPTELQVVKFAAEGLSNPEIGERMSIGRGTVKTHLTHVFAKLGLSTRAALAAEATRRDA
jgi:DNA-binding CsgD family transcriptional regulator